jgi:hypothetical protein
MNRLSKYLNYVVTLLILFTLIKCQSRPTSMLTVPIIDSLNDDDLLFEVFKDIAERHTGHQDKKKEIISQLTKEQQGFYALTVVEMEVNNGGFNQYYYNNGGEFADAAVEGFKMVGANKFAELVTRANNIYREETKKITGKQDGTLQGFSESYKDNPLNNLDKEFYKLYEEESLTKLTADFVRKNKLHFIK